MSPQDKEFLIACRWQYEQLMETGTVKNINLPAFREIMINNFQKNLSLDHQSYDDVKHFLIRLYLHFDQWIAAGALPPKPEQPEVEISVL